MKSDYSGLYVSPTNFLSVLEGKKPKGESLTGSINTGRVLESKPEDNVFLYFADHGAPGLIAFPSKYLHADELLSGFSKMKGKYGKLVFYLEVI